MEFITREITNIDWITITILSSVILLSIAKTVNTTLFSDFTVLFSTNKYLVLHQKSNKLSSLFNTILILFQIISFSLFIYLSFNILEWKFESSKLLLFFKITTIYTVIVICKLLIEKIIAAVFSIEPIIDDYLFYKISYRNFTGIILLIINIIFTYTGTPPKLLLAIIFISLTLFNLMILFSYYKKHENIIFNNLFYFILYLCTLEIAPYFMLYKLIISYK